MKARGARHLKAAGPAGRRQQAERSVMAGAVTGIAAVTLAAVALAVAGALIAIVVAWAF